MDLYFSPLACSLSARIAFYEAGADARFIYVDTRTGRTEDGADFRAINAQGQVPVLRTPFGLLTENAAVLQCIADACPASGLAPANGPERYRLQEWLNFITSELHKMVFIALLDETAPDGAKQYARAAATPRFDYLDGRLAGREFLLDRFSVADAYLTAILNWAAPSGIDLARWPNVKRYHDRMRARPAIAKAFAEEFKLYGEQQARRKAA